MKDIAKPKEDLLEQEEPYREYRMYYMLKKSHKEEEVIKREGTKRNTHQEEKPTEEQLTEEPYHEISEEYQRRAIGVESRYSVYRRSTTISRFVIVAVVFGWMLGSKWYLEEST